MGGGGTVVVVPGMLMPHRSTTGHICSKGKECARTKINADLKRQRAQIARRVRFRHCSLPLYSAPKIRCETVAPCHGHHDGFERFGWL